MPWQELTEMDPQQFRCGYCGFNVASIQGYSNTEKYNQSIIYGRIYMCPNCDRPTFFDVNSRRYPGVAPGNEVGQIPKELEKLYREARNCCSVSAFTASVLASRKMLMNIAVQQGAQEGLKFIEYVEFLALNGFIPPNGRGWVDHIRKKGNEATHEIALMTQSEAEELVTFSEMLLKFIYEFPSRVPSP